MFIEKRFIVPFSLLLLIVGFAALLAVVGMTVRLGDRANEHFDEVIRTRDVRVSAVEIRSAVQSAESSQRGLLLTGNEIYLSPYDAAKTSANRQLDNLKRILGTDGQFQAVLQRLTVILAEKFQEMDRTIALKGERKDIEALAIINTNRGKALMDEANLFVSGIVLSMDNRLTVGVDEQRANATNLRRASAVAAALIVLVVSAVAVTLLTYTKELTRTQAKVTALNLSLEERVRARTAALARANEEIQQFAHLLSHDMRAPLISIVGFTNELEESVQDLQKLVDGSDPNSQKAGLLTSHDMPEAIGFIRKSTQKMDSLLSAVLKISREGGRLLNAEVIDLRELISSSSAAIQHQLSEAGGEVVVDLNVSFLKSDKLSLGQVTGNLLDNAVKYRASGRPLRIEVRSSALPNDQIAIEITDNGRGIAAAFLGFSGGLVKTTSQARGSGLLMCGRWLVILAEKSPPPLSWTRARRFASSCPENLNLILLRPRDTDGSQIPTIEMDHESCAHRFVRSKRLAGDGAGGIKRHYRAARLPAI